MLNMSKETIERTKTCPLCGDTGSALGRLFVGKVGVYLIGGRNRARIEITADLLKPFMNQFSSGEKVAIFVMSVKEKHELTPDELERAIESS